MGRGSSTVGMCCGFRKRCMVDYRWRWALPLPAFERVRRFGRKGLTTFAICIQYGAFIPPHSYVLLIFIHSIPPCLCLCCLHCCFSHPGCSPCCLLILLKLMLLLQLMDQLLELWGSYNLCLAIKQLLPCLVLCTLSFLMYLILSLVECHCCQGELDML